MITLFLLLACNRESAAPAEAAIASVSTAAVERVAFRPSAELTGSLEPIASVQLGFDVPGRLETLLVRRGQTVEKGDALARLDARMAAAQLAQAEGALAGAKAQVAAGEATIGRLQQLQAAGGVSAQQLGDAEAGLAAGRAGVEQAEAAVRLARTHVGNHTLRAPIDGVVTNGPDNAGTMVGAGTPLFVLEDLSALQLKATAPESASWIAPGQEAVLRMSGAEGEVRGAVSLVLPSLDPATRRIPVEIRFDAPPAWLRAHAFARVTVTAADEVEAFRVPSAAVVARPDFCVFRTAEGGSERVPVEVVQEGGGMSVVRAVGLTERAVVLLDPAR